MILNYVKSLKVEIKRIDIYDKICFFLLRSYNKNFKKNTRTRTFGKSVTKATVTGLQSNKTYYAKVRGVRTSSSGKKTYGKYSTVKKCKIK